MGAKIFVSRLINNLVNLLPEESTTSDPRFKRKVQETLRNLRSLKETLKDDVGLASGGLLQLQAVYSAEDVTDTLLTLKEFLEIKMRDNSVFKNFPWRRSSWSWQIQLTGEMKKLKNQIKALSSDEHLHLINKKEAAEATILNIDDVIGGITYLSFRNHEDPWAWQRISGFCFEQETNLVGLEEQINKLVSLLIPEQNHNDKVIAIVGEAGSGKTTLVRRVYDRADVKRHFAKRAWVRVRSGAKVRDVLIDIFQQINDEMLVEASSPEEELASSLAALVKETSYLIVVEDVETPQVWQVLRNALYHSSSKSKDGKLILTTSDENYIPLEVKAAGSTLHVGRLDEKESWELLLKRVPLPRAGKSELVALKERIMEICGGLPIRIVLLAGLLSAIKGANYQEWSRVIERAGVDKSDGGGINLLALSYQELPSELKPFFLYMGLFPRASEIPVRRLIHLWCAEGFVAPIATDLAENYLEELVIRNLIQVTKWRLDGTPKMCRMPSILYDIFSPEAAKAGFFHYQSESSSAEQQQPQFAVRRLATNLGVSTEFIPSEWSWSWHLRSYVAFDTRVQGSPATEISVFLDKMITAKINRGGFVLLTVLDLEGVYKPKLSDDVIGKLLNLSYLGLRSTFIDSLPKSVGILPHLETLDVKHTKLQFLPDSIWKAKKLQHLYLNWIHSPIDGLRFSSLNNLQTLWGLSIESYTPPRLSDSTELPGLRKLGVKCDSQRAIDSITNLISRLPKLQSSKLVCARMNKFLVIEDITDSVMLRELYLRGPLGFHDILPNYPNLKILTLSMSLVESDPMPKLGKLVHLNILRLYREAYSGQEMTCKSRGFPQLRVLKLWNLFNLKEWTVEIGAMPRLRELEIRSCNNLKPPQPQGLQNLTNTLKEFVLTNMPSTFEEAVQPILQGTNVHIQKNQWRSFL